MKVSNINKDNVDEKFKEYHQKRPSLSEAEQVDVCKKLAEARVERNIDRMEKNNYKMKVEAEHKKLVDEKQKRGQL